VTATSRGNLHQMAGVLPSLHTRCSLPEHFRTLNGVNCGTPKVEHKCKFFSWLILQNKKVWTADRILKVGGQPNPICQLCSTHPESATHMIIECTYSRGVWAQLAPWLGIALQPLPLANHRQFKTWWSNMSCQGHPDRQEKQHRLQKLIYLVWEIWKERDVAVPMTTRRSRRPRWPLERCPAVGRCLGQPFRTIGAVVSAVSPFVFLFFFVHACNIDSSLTQ
jgi:hypothetical protein